MADIASMSDSLTLGEDGIWYAAERSKVSYPIQGNDNCFALESSSFWFNHRNRCIVSVVNTFPPVDGGPILDIGGGNGFVSMGLARAGYDVVLLEPGPSGARNARQRGLEHVICASSDNAHLKPGSFAAVGLFDVIEHIEDDAGFLCSIKTLLRKGGRLYATVPAYSSLWSDHDVEAGHFRRYTLPEICELLTSVGFRIDYGTYFFRPLPVPVYLLRTMPFKLRFRRSRPAADQVQRDHASSNRTFSNCLQWILRPEIGLINRRKKMHFGGSCILAAQLA